MKDKILPIEEMIEQEINKESKGEFLVLIVDDYPENLVFVGDLLMQQGIKTDFAQTGEEAIKKATQNTPDLILLDIAMPVMDGYETCRRLKMLEGTKHVPVIFVTAKIESDDIIKGFEAGGSDYVTKPFNFMELMSRVKAHLEIKTRQDQLTLINEKLIESVKDNSSRLKEANERLSNLDRAKNDFLIHINHQLRTPLNGILGYTELLSTKGADITVKEYIGEIKKLVKRLVKLSERSLLFTELKAENYKLNIQLISPVESIKKSILTVQDRYPENKHVKFIHNIPSDDFKVYADENLFFRCCNIILDNALKFSNEGGFIFIDYKEENDVRVVKIKDQGRGISKEYKEKLFQVFSSDSKNNDNGFGLGLATAKLIMDIQAGEVVISDVAEGGTEVKLLFYNWSQHKNN